MTRPTTTIVLTMTIVVTAAVASSDQPHWECWGPDLPDPCRNNLLAVATVPGTTGGSVWAVGKSGTIVGSPGGPLQRYDTGTSARLVDVAMAAEDRGWAVGDEGKLFQWRGHGWSEVRNVVGEGTQVRAIAVVPGTDRPQAWVAADWMGFGSFHRFTGSFWEDSGDDYYGVIKDMEFVDENHGWAISSSIGDSVFYRWDGSSWSEFARFDDDYIDLALTGADHGWALERGGGVLIWDGTAWTAGAPISEYSLNAIAAVSEDDAWAVGGTYDLFHWDGSSWNQVWLGISSVYFYDIAFAGPNVGWMVGDAGVIMRYDGVRWTALNLPHVPRFDQLAASPGADPQIWAEGWGSHLLRWGGSLWAPVESPARYVRSLEMVSADDGWANGDEAFHRWDGRRWTRFQEAEDSDDMVFVTADDGWAVGRNTIHHWDGFAWTSMESPVDMSLYGVSAATADDVWVFGSEDGVMAHFDGAEWHAVEVPVIDRIRDITMPEPGRGIAVGGSWGQGEALQYINGTWLNLAVPSSSPALRAVDVKRFDNGLFGWMVGDEGESIRLSGGLWLQEPTPTSSDLLDVVTVSPTEAWAVGRDGVILHWGESLPTATPGGDIIPATAKLAGQAGTDWRTDLVLTNLGDDPATVQLLAWMRDVPNPDPEARSITLAPMTTEVSGDVLSGLFGFSDSAAATIHVACTQPLGVTSRTFNVAAGGTFGQSIPPIAVSRLFGAGQDAHVVGLIENSKARSNLGIVNPTDGEIVVTATFFDAAGDPLGTKDYAVPATSSIQRTRVLRDVVSGPIDVARAVLHSQQGSFMAYASTVDAVTGDPVYRPAMAVAPNPNDGVMQGIARVGGAAGTDWKSSIILTNVGDATSTVRFSRLLRGQANPVPVEVSVSLAPGEIRVIDDAMAELFGMHAGAASLSVFASATTLVSGRTFNQTDHGTYGQTIPLQPRSDAITVGAAGYFVGVVQNSDFRSNLGLTNSTGSAAWVALDLYDTDGARVGNRQSLKLSPGETIQIDRVVEAFGISGIQGATLVVKPATGSSVDAFLSTIDSRTGDPVFQVPTIN
jgi:hypothetical protein